MIFTRDFVTRENYWQIASLVTQKSLFTVTHALFFISNELEIISHALVSQLWRRLWRHDQQNVNRASETQGPCVNIDVFIAIYGWMRYVVYEMFVECLFTNKYQNKVPSRECINSSPLEPIHYSISMAQWKTAVIPLVTHLSYYSLALSHQYICGLSDQ